MKLSPAIKVGILTITSLVILILGIMWLKGRALSSGKRIEVVFNDVDGMRPGSAVQMMGLRVGQIEEITPYITLDKSFVKVKFVVTEPNIEIPIASEISIQQSGIIGEKFLEITPPKTQFAYIPAPVRKKLKIHQNDSVEIPVEGEFVDVGKVKSIELINTMTLPLVMQQDISTSSAYKVGYVVTTPGLQLPDKLKISIERADGSYDQYKLRLTPPIYSIVQLPEVSSPYTIVEPMRMKEFFDLQLEAAKSLNETNNKVNTILSEDAIMDLKITLKNIKQISTKANTTLDNANLLLANSKNEIDNVVNMADKLSGRLTVLTDNVNGIVGDPEFKKTLISTTKSVNDSTKRISDILSDKKTQETLANLNETSKNLAELSAYVNEVSKDKVVKKKVSDTVDNLNSSLLQLSNSLQKVDTVTGSQEDTIKNILNDSAEISKNVRIFSERLNKRFLLIRLMFQ